MQRTDARGKSDSAPMADFKDEVRLARQFFTRVERMSTLLSSYPTGHPVVEQAVASGYQALYDYFELNDRLTVQVDPHNMLLSGTDAKVWETEDPKDVCFALSRDGIFLIHLLAGLTEAELRRFVGILNALVDPADMDTEAVSLLFDANFTYIAYEAIDESLASLAGIDADIRDRDTNAEREMIDEMFNDAFENVEERSSQQTDSPTMDEQFQIRTDQHAASQNRLELGSRDFLSLDSASQTHLNQLKRGFTEHAELEHREGEMLSALLGARPKPALQRECVGQVGQVMGTLVEGDQPWEALRLLKLIHAWRDRFAAEVTGELKATVNECFTQKRLNLLTKQVANGDQRQRRAILKMFNALDLPNAASGLVGVLGWNLDDAARSDILAYIRKQADIDLQFLAAAVSDVPADQVDGVLDIIIERMPKSRPILVDILDSPHEPATKTRALESLHGTWDDPTEIRDQLVPLLEASNTDVQMEAIRNFVDAAPQHVARVMGPMIDSDLRSRPEDEIREIITLFVDHGRAGAIDHIESLVRRRGMVGVKEQDLAVVVIRALVNSRNPKVVELLKDTSKDWLVPKRIRKNCQEVAELLS